MKNTTSPTDGNDGEDFFIDLEKLRAKPVTELQLHERILSHIPVKKPSKEWFFRVNPELSIDCLVLELKEDGEVFLIAPRLQDDLTGEKCAVYRRLQIAVNRQGTVFLWAIRLPNDGRRDAWATTSLDAATMAVTRWVRLQADMSLGGYQIDVAKIDIEPNWPKQPFNELLRIAFKNAVIDDLDHPVLKKLRGEI